MYTIATPHGGVDYTALNVAYCTPAADDLKNESMDGFNKRFTYEKFNNPETGKRIPFMAYHFECSTCGGFSDCIVGTDNQTWKGAPGAPNSRSGSHTDDKVIGDIVVCKAELSQTDVLYEILMVNK